VVPYLTADELDGTYLIADFPPCCRTPPWPYPRIYREAPRGIPDPVGVDIPRRPGPSQEHPAGLVLVSVEHRSSVRLQQGRAGRVPSIHGHTPSLSRAASPGSSAGPGGAGRVGADRVAGLAMAALLRCVQPPRAPLARLPYDL